MRVERDALSRFGSRVRAERARRGLSQQELAVIADLHRTYIGGVERGERNISLLNLLRLARALDVGAGALLDDGDSV